MNKEQELAELRKEIMQLAEMQEKSAARLAALHQRLYQLEQSNEMEPLGALKPRNYSPDQARRQSLFSEDIIGLRILHLAGIIVLVAGIVFGVKYAIDKSLLSEGLRIILAYLAAIGLGITALRLKKNYSLFSAILLSGSLAILYFTTYAATAYYQFISVPAAFTGMFGITLLAIYVAIHYQRKEIAQVGMVGAYAIPFLLSSEKGNVLLLFSYIAVINGGIVFLYLRKKWSQLFYQAVLITWLIFAGWAVWKYDDPYFFTGNIFLLYFHLFFLGAILVPVITRHIKPGIGLLTCHMLNQVAFYLAVLSVTPFTQAVTTGLVSIWSGIIWLTLLRLPGLQDKLWVHLQGLYTIVLVALYIAIAFDGIIITVLWLLVAMATFAGGAFFHSAILRMTAIVLVGVTLAKLLVLDRLLLSAGERILSYILIGLLLLAVSFYYQRQQKRRSLVSSNKQ